jgi:hypothetical protein
MTATSSTARRRPGAGAAPLSPQRKWRAITIATVLLVPAFWALLYGLVTVATEGSQDAASAGAAIAFGLSVIPFVFVVLAFLSEHPRAPGAVVRAMGVSLLVGIPVSALAADAVTGLVAGVGAGGALALRPEPDQGWRPRALGVLVASCYTFVLARAAGSAVLFPAPVFALTCLGLADHLAAWHRRR